MPEMTSKPFAQSQPKQTAASLQAANEKNPLPASKTGNFGDMKPAAQVQLLALQQRAGNQAVQRMLATSRTAAKHPQEPVIQRLAFGDIGIFNLVEPPADQAQMLIQLFTDWENEAVNPVQLALRQKLSRDRINDFIDDDRMRYMQNREQLFHYLKTNVFDQLVKDEAVMEPPSSYEIFCQLVFKWNKVDERELHNAISLLPNMSADEQRKVIERLYAIQNVNMLSHLVHFHKLHENFHLIMDLCYTIIASRIFQNLSDQEQQTNITYMLGEGSQKDVKLDRLVTQFPSLSLILPPPGFFTEDSLDQDKVTAVYPGEEFKQLVSIIAKANNQGEMSKALKQLGQFILSAPKMPQEMIKVIQSLKSIIKLHNPALRQLLFVSLGDLLQKLNLYTDQQAEQKEDNYSDTESDRSYDEESDSSTMEVNPNDLVTDIEKSSEPLRLLRLMLSVIYPQYLGDSDVANFLANGKTRKLLKDAPVQHKLLHALSTLKNRLASWAPDIVQRIFRDTQASGSDATIEAFVTTELLIKLGYSNALINCQDMSELQEIIDGQIGDALGLHEDELSSGGLEHLILKFRNVTDLLTYASKLANIDDQEQKEQAVEGFKQFVLSVMQDPDNSAYQKFRYGESDYEKDSEVWEHLTIALDLPSVREEWKKGAEQIEMQEEKEWLVRDTDAPSDMLLLGTDIETCQSIHNGSFNECLLSYLIDGKNRAIVIKQRKTNLADKDSKIVGRALFKLLLDDEYNVVLYLEKVYVDGTQIKEQDAKRMLLSMAKQRARELSKYLNLKLLSPSYNGFNGGTPASCNLHSLGGPAPFDYNDTKLASGPPAFTIDHSSMVELPID